jgi:hypothetical protein
MRKVAADANDELKPEYDLRNLRVRKVGANRKNFGNAMICSKAEVADMFPDSKLVSDKGKK